jgi:hypothetical protein
VVARFGTVSQTVRRSAKLECVFKPMSGRRLRPRTPICLLISVNPTWEDVWAGRAAADGGHLRCRLRPSRPSRHRKVRPDRRGLRAVCAAHLALATAGRVGDYACFSHSRRALACWTHRSFVTPGGLVGCGIRVINVGPRRMVSHLSIFLPAKLPNSSLLASSAVHHD